MRPNLGSAEAQRVQTLLSAQRFQCATRAQFGREEEQPSVNSWLWVFTGEYLCSLGHVGHKKVHDGHIFHHMEDPASWTLLLLVAVWLRRGVCAPLFEHLGGETCPASIRPLDVVLTFITLHFRLVVTCPCLNGTPVPTGTLLL